MARFTVPTPTHGAAPSHTPPDTKYVPGERTARGLGWFSIGLGVVELVAPRALSQLTGVRHPELLRAYGLREIICGVGILASDRPHGWMWARVGGDALDLATIGEELAEASGERRNRLLATGAAVAGVLGVDAMVSAQMTAAKKLEG